MLILYLSRNQIVYSSMISSKPNQLLCKNYNCIFSVINVKIYNSIISIY